uniref:Ig-like domain-containing protein n=1 Tax=Terrapene triunguis TaxID=2587831 RepID=A0A674J191_9SAUR
ASPPRCRTTGRGSGAASTTRPEGSESSESPGRSGLGIQNFYPRGIHRIQWRCDGKTWEKCEPTDCSQNPDLTFSATSVWRLPSDQITRPELRVQVSVQQSPREPPIEREIRAGDTGLLRPPEVSEISQPESVTARKEITLSCHMTGHFPRVLSVTWLRRDRGAGAAVPLQGSAEYRIEPGAPRTQDGKSFQQETRLSFTPSVQRDQGAEYVCCVGHTALGNLPIEKRTRVLEVTGQSAALNFLPCS